MSFLPVALRFILIVCGFAFAGIAWLLFNDVAGALPDRTKLKWIDIAVPDQQYVVLGRAQFAQPIGGATAERHVAIERSGDAIYAFDIAAQRRIGYYTISKKYYSSDRAYIDEGDSILQIGRHKWNLTRNGSTLILSGGKPDIRAALGPLRSKIWWRDIPFVYNANLIDDLKGLQSNSAITFRLGGDTKISSINEFFQNRQIPDNRLPFGAASIRFLNGDWFVTSSTMPVIIRSSGKTVEAGSSKIPILDATGKLVIDSMIIGRTSYKIEDVGSNHTIRFRVIKRPAWLNPEDVQDPTSSIDGAIYESPILKPEFSVHQKLIKESRIQETLIYLAIVLTALFFINLLTISGIASLSVAFAAVGVSMTLLGPSSAQGMVFTSIGSGMVVMGGFGFIERRFQSFGRHILNFGIFGVGMMFAAAGYVLFGSKEEFSIETSIMGAWLALLAPLLVQSLSLAATLFWVLLLPVILLPLIAGIRLTALEQTERWVGLLEKHLFAIAVIGLFSAILVGLARSGGPFLRRSIFTVRNSMLLRIFAGIVFILITLTTLLGGETGFRGIFQPSEAAKSIVIVLVAIVLFRDLARRTMLAASEGVLNIIWVFLAVVMTFAIMFAGVLNYDMSPVIVTGSGILVTMLIGSYQHFVKLARHRGVRRYQGLPIVRRARSQLALSFEQIKRISFREIMIRSSAWPVALVLFVFLAISVIVTTFIPFDNFRENATVTESSALVTPWRRFQSWHDMDLKNDDLHVDFPETSLQLRLAREALLEAKCLLWRDICSDNNVVDVSLAATPQSVASLLRLPAVQDDFAAVSLVHTIGIDGALVYTVLQAALIAVAFGIGLTAMFAKGMFGPATWMAGAATFGMTAVLATQFILAWGNVLGFFPVMGQPMTFVAFGASHHLGVALPFVLITLIASITADQKGGLSVTAKSQIFRRRIAG